MFGHSLSWCAGLLAALAVGLAPGDAPAQASKGQRKCVRALNKGLTKAMDVQSRLIAACVKDRQADPARDRTVEACIAQDERGRIERVRRKTEARALKRCDEPPDFAATDPATVVAAATGEGLELLHDVLGLDPDGVLIAKAVDARGAKCQVAVLRASGRCVRAQLKAFNRCKKEGLKGRGGAAFENMQELRDRCLGVGSEGIPDTSRGKIEKACVGKLRRRLDAKCEGLDLATVFPGCGLADPNATVACIGRATRCRVCLALDIADALDRDCDLVDDGLPNGSCVPRPRKCGPGEHWIDSGCDPGLEPLNGSHAELAIDLDGDCIADVTARLFGAVSLERSPSRDVSTVFSGPTDCGGGPCGTPDGHLDVIDLAQISMRLESGGVSLRLGSQASVPLAPSRGVLVEEALDPSRARAFYKLFAELEVNGLRLYNQTPLVLESASAFECFPPDVSYVSSSACLPLFDAPVGGQLRANLVSLTHDTNRCGNGVLGDGEQCDGIEDSACPGECQADCSCAGTCGDGVVQPPETCDDMNTTDGDGCSAGCRLEVCGNRLVQEPEECDDGNDLAGDGCSALCQVEFCGDGRVQGLLGERCDDGNSADGDGCSAECQLESCGDGVLDPLEACDDANTSSGDGCSDVCVIEFCGDQTLQPGLGEECDDGNVLAGDGCSEGCVVEFCGDGVVNGFPLEACDGAADGACPAECGPDCRCSCSVQIEAAGTDPALCQAGLAQVTTTLFPPTRSGLFSLSVEQGGALVRSLASEVRPGGISFLDEWDGTDAAAQAVPPGPYTLRARWENDVASCEATRPIGVIGVEILDASFASADHVQIARWDAAFTGTAERPAVRAAFASSDPERFYVRVTGVEGVGSVGSVEFSSFGPGADPDVSPPLDMIGAAGLESLGGGSFLADPRILVVNEDALDDDFVQSPDVDGSDDGADDPTLFAVLEGRVRASYTSGELTCQSVVEVCDRIPARETLTRDLRVHVLRVDGIPVVSSSEVIDDIALMDAAWAQCCLEFQLEGVIALVDPPAAEPFGDFGYDHDGLPGTAPVGTGDGVFSFLDVNANGLHDPNEPGEPFTDENGNGGYDFGVDLSDGLDEFEIAGPLAGIPTREERSLIDSLADSDPRTIEYIVVNALDQGSLGEAFVPSVPSMAANLASLNVMIVAAGAVGLDPNQAPRDFVNSAHEAGHVLLDAAGHRDPETLAGRINLMVGGGTDLLDSVTSSKRLEFGQCSVARSF